MHERLSKELLYRVSRQLLNEFVKVNLLLTNQSVVRNSMHSLLHGIYHKYDTPDKIELLKLLWSHWPHLSQYGKKGKTTTNKSPAYLSSRIILLCKRVSFHAFQLIVIPKQHSMEV